MAVIRVNKDKNYTTMSNYHFRDKSLSLKAKGLLSQMLSLPDEWDYTIAGLTAINRESESAIKSALGELKSCGYLIVTKKMPDQTESGRIEYEYDIYEHPHQKQEIEKQGVENLPLENQGIENNGQLSTDEFITNNKRTKQSNIDNQYIKSIVEYLNSKADKNYRPTTESTARHIRARLNEGFSVDNFFTVIDKKVAEWKGTAMDLYLRPETLFGSKFESYLNAKTRSGQKRGANGVLIDDRQADELDGIL